MTPQTALPSGTITLCLEESAVQKAVTLFGAANALREIWDEPLPTVRQAEHDKEIAKARLVLDEAAFSAAWEQGRAMPWEQATEYALQSD